MKTTADARRALRHLLAGACWMTAGGVHAAPVIDASYLVPTDQFRGGIPVIPGSTAAQSVTVGLDGLLTRIDLQVGGEADYPMTLEIGRGSDPNTDTLLASFGFTAPRWTPTGGVYAITSIDVSAASIDVDPGDRLVLSLSSASRTFGGWAAGNALSDGVYGGGEAYRNGLPQGFDVAFRLWVDPVGQVPEPASGALVLSGLAIAAALRRARR